MERLRSFSDFSGIQIARNTTECEHLDIPKYPSTIAGFLNEKRFHIPFDDVTDLINIEQSCTAFVFPYMNIDLSPILKSSEKDISKYFELQIKESSDENKNLIREVFSHTPSPQYIRGITTSFAGDVIGGRFVAIEWNFGEEDWLHECLDLHNLDQDHVERCKKLRIAKKTTDLNSDYKSDIYHSFISQLPGNETAIYIPITDLSHYEKFKEFEEKLVHSGYEIYNRDDLGDYLEYHFGDCQFTRDHFQSVIKQLEMEIAVISNIFFYSFSSDWSYSTLMERTVRNPSGTNIPNHRILSKLNLN